MMEQNWRIVRGDITLSRKLVPSAYLDQKLAWVAELHGPLRPRGPVVHLTATGDTASEALEAVENLIRANGWRVSDV